MTAATIIIPGIADDGTLFPIEKMAAHANGGQLHVAISVFVMCGTQLLLQRRAADKYHCGGLWANSCCSHPHWGEEPAHSAKRRLHEELGLDLALNHTATVDYDADVGNGLHERERVHAFKASTNNTVLTVRPALAEVSETMWADIDWLKADAQANAAAYAPWFLIYLRRWPELNLD